MQKEIDINKLLLLTVKGSLLFNRVCGVGCLRRSVDYILKPHIKLSFINDPMKFNNPMKTLSNLIGYKFIIFYLRFSNLIISLALLYLTIL